MQDPFSSGDSSKNKEATAGVEHGRTLYQSPLTEGNSPDSRASVRRNPTQLKDAKHVSRHVDDLDHRGITQRELMNQNRVGTEDFHNAILPFSKVSVLP